MGTSPSTPRRGGRLGGAEEELMGIFIGEKSYPISSDFWNKLLEVPHTFHWPPDHVIEACQIFSMEIELLNLFEWNFQNLSVRDKGACIA
ncbi:hypothetical protein HPP92_015629 [Vanilla planifolia]|uniref:Dymeclin n=1 Tax=Vanilla planifolia TaxID=51239 RepID=A0A835QTY7_VANPL|nr:hypothetical protein HPP92_015629 [Vanilla planifolia]